VPELDGIGKMLVIFGGVIVVVGLLWGLVGRIPGIGRLPGDIVVHRGSLSFYFPLVTSLLLSLILTVLFRLFGRR
jgi:hypothetical protein